MRTDTLQDWHQRVDRALGELLRRLDEPYALKTLAEEMASSPFHFHRMFKALTGETVGRCVRRLRLERAGFLLRQTSLDVTSIALETGFSSGENLARAFRATWGLPPSRLRTLAAFEWRITSAAGIHYSPTATKTWHFRLSGEGASPMDVKIVSLPPWRLAGLKHIGDYWGLPEVWARFHKEASRHGLFQPGCSVMCAFLDHWDDLPMEVRRSYPAVTLKPAAELPAGELELLNAPGGMYACTPHFGSYETIGDTWMRWRRAWLPASGWQPDPSRPSLEWYQNHPDSTPTELLLTLLCDPVKAV